MKSANLKRHTITASIALLAFGMALPASGKTYTLDARSYSATLPDGQMVTMWGYCTHVTTGSCTPGALFTLTVPAGDTLSVTLYNYLPEPTSIVIPGLQSAQFSPVMFQDAARRMRVRSFVPEAPINGGTATYTWTAKAGTYLFHSGTHPGIQVQMGLYGAVTADASAANGSTLAQVYSGVPYGVSQVLLYSEIDKCLHDSVAPTDGSMPTYGQANYAAGTGPLAPASCGPNGLPTQLPNTTVLAAPFAPTSPMYYAPTYYMVNGSSYASLAFGATRTVAGTISLSTVPVLLRFVNAGNKTHIPEMATGGYMTLVAEDGNKYQYPQTQYSAFLPAGKTIDALWTPPAADPSGTTYALIDKSGNNNTAATGSTQVPGGMIVEMAFVSTNPQPLATANSYSLVTGTTLTTTAATGVMANDSNVTGGTAMVDAKPAHAATFTLNSDGSFTYIPAAGYIGTDTFTYHDVVGGNYSNVATVTITITPAVPTVISYTATTPQNTPVTVSVLAGATNSAGVMGGANLAVTNLTQPVGGSGFGTVGSDPTQTLVKYTPPAVPDPTFGANAMIAQASDGSLTSIVVTGTTATVTCAAACAAPAGSTVIVAGAPAATLPATSLNGTYTVLAAPAPTATTFAFTVAATVAPVTYNTAPLAVVTPVALLAQASDGSLTSIAVTGTSATVTCAAACAVPAGSTVIVAGAPAATLPATSLNGTYTVLATPAPTATTFAFPVANTVTTGLFNTLPLAVFVPTSTGNTSVTFAYAARDTTTSLISNPANVNVTVTNVAPVAVPDTAVTTNTAPAQLNVLANDYAPGSTLDPTSVKIVGQPLNGTVAVNPLSGIVTYTSTTPSFIGSDTFNYTVNNTLATPLTSNVATVTVHVNANTGLIANPDTANTLGTLPVTISVLNNDVNSAGVTGGTGLSVTSVIQPSTGLGTATTNGTTITYTPPAAGFAAGTAVTFQYQATDASTARLTNLANVTVYVGPVLSTISPNVGNPGTVVPVNITGNNLGISPLLSVSGAGIAASTPVVNAAGTSLTSNFTIASGSSAIGAHTVVVTAGGSSNPLTFSVVGATLTSVTPNSGARGSTGTGALKVTFTGANLTGASSVTAALTGGTGLTCGTVAVTNSTTVTASCAITSTATLGTWNLALVTPLGTTNTVPFTVAGPTLTSITPNSGYRNTNTTAGTTNPQLSVTLTGTNLTGAYAVTIGNGVTATNVVVVNSTTVTAKLNITTGANLTAVRNVTVTTPNGTTTDTVPFSVVVPTLTSISPTGGWQGNTVAVTLKGAGFFGETGITITGIANLTNFKIVDTNTITATVAVPTTLATGNKDVTVTGGNGASINPVTFLVNNPPLPTITGISPGVGTHGTAVQVTIAGTNFSTSNSTPSGTTISMGSGVSCTGVANVNAAGTSGTSTCTLPGTASTRTVTVTNPGGTSTTGVPFTIK